jgi:hypothetical protein
MSASLSAAFRASKSPLLVANFARDRAEALATDARPVRFTSYSSLLQMLEELDEQDCEAAQKNTVILVLDERFCGHLPSMLDRENLGGKLVVASLSGQLPPLATCSHPEVISIALGWNQIRFTSDALTAIQEEGKRLKAGGELLVLWPE